MTKHDTMKDRNMEDLTYDTALPQSWVDDAQEKVKPFMEDVFVPGHFVWLYSGNESVGGRPYPLTETGIKILSIMACYK